MDGGFPGELMLGEHLLELFGTGYTRILLVHLRRTASVSWMIEANAMVCGLGMRTEEWRARLANAIPSQSHERKRGRSSATVGATSGEAVERQPQVLILYFG